MLFNSHSQLAGSHAFLSPSNYHWVNYDDEKLDAMFMTSLAARRGVELHDFAHNAIRLGIKLPDNSTTMSMYVNDGIGYRMTTEQMLFYSVNCYGSADSIAFRHNLLRIHDLKTGVTPAAMTQLKVYTSLFCLEYKKDPFKIGVELRIYQSDDVQILTPDPDEIMHIMDRIKVFDKRINDMKLEAM